MSEKPRFKGRFISATQDRRIKCLKDFRSTKDNYGNGNDRAIDSSQENQVVEVQGNVDAEIRADDQCFRTDHDYCKRTDNPHLSSCIEVGYESDHIHDEEFVTVSERYTCTYMIDTQNISWRHGRRIVELGHLADQLAQGCRKCSMSLELKNVVKELRYGLGSLLYVKCSQPSCKQMTPVSTGKRHGSKGQRAWDVNSKFSLGTLHAGIGDKKARGLLSTLNIPPLSSTSYKVKEREVGTVVENIAKQSCIDIAAEEKRLSGSSEELTVAFDGGWQKRGSGRSYSSLSGHGTMIGSKTQKCIAYATRNKFCRFCDAGRRENTSTSCHDCRKNWTGSSKAMEPDMCVAMLKNLESQNYSVGTLVMDNDSTTIARARCEVNPALKKQADKNHTLKELNNKLFDLKKSKNYKELNSKSIAHLGKCFRYCIAQNQGKKDEMCRNLEAVPLHVFGDHRKCDVIWCGYLKSPLHYKPSNLPYSRYFSDQLLRADLTKLFQKYADQSEKLINLSSTQSNESMNNMIASKTPKSNFYSGSESNDFRVAAAVAQKNLGNGYVAKVNETVFLSPGEITQTEAEKNDRKRKNMFEKSHKVEFKRRRVHKKERMLQHQMVSETREGMTYERNVDFNNNTIEDVQQIPPCVTKPTCIPLQSANYTYICFDLETTGLGRDCHITQIAACHGDNETFSHYVLPVKPIEPQASQMTGLSCAGLQLYKDGKPVNTMRIRKAINQFLLWLGRFPNPVLVAHNATFDANVMSKTLSNLSIDATNKISGFVDSISVFKTVLPGRSHYALRILVKELLNEDYDAHNAVADVNVLYKLLNVNKATEIQMLKHSFSLAYIHELDKYQSSYMQNHSSLMPLVNDGILSKQMIAKVAGSGLSLSHLLLAYKRDNMNGIKNIFGERGLGNKPRVTNNMKIVQNVCKYCESVSK